MEKWFLLLYLSANSLHAAGAWVQFHSQHFEVFTDAGSGTGGEVMRRLEQIRQVFASLIGPVQRTASPTRVVVFQREADFRLYQSNRNAAGYYYPTAERDYIVMRVTGPDIYRVVYHEYTHLLMRNTGVRAPAWFNEGFAEFFSTVDVGSSEIRIGGPIPSHVLTLRSERLLDMATLAGVNLNSPYYNERRKSGIFYAQSWALIHMLNFVPEYRARLLHFAQMTSSGEDMVDAMQTAFGKTPALVLEDLRTYLRRETFGAERFGIGRLDVSNVAAEPVSFVATQLLLAELLLAINKLDAAGLIYSKLEAAFPGRGDVLLALGQFSVRRSELQDAKRYFEGALAKGASSARLFYDYAVVLRNVGEPEREVIHNLERAVGVDPTFFEGHKYLGYVHLQAGRFEDAIGHLQRAADLQPGEGSVWESLAVAHYKLGHIEAAHAAATTARRYVSGSPEMSRMDALMDMIESDNGSVATTPALPRTDVATPRPPIARASGTLAQVDCLGAQARLYILTDAGKVILLVRDASAVRVSGGKGDGGELACGAVISRRVIVEYVPEHHRSYGTIGVLTSIVFL